MAADLSPDLCVIGAGSAGLSVAAVAARLGAATVLVERGGMGGECLNTGCVPSKALLAAAKAAQAVRRAPAFGIDAPPPEVDFARVRGHARETIAAVAPHDSAERFEGLGVRVIRAEAARERHGARLRLVRSEFADNDRARTERETAGPVEFVAAPSGRILGASILGPQAGELIQLWRLAIERRLKLKHVARMIAPYPALGATGRRAAGEFYRRALFSPWTRRLVRALARWP